MVGNPTFFEIDRNNCWEAFFNKHTFPTDSLILEDV